MTKETRDEEFLLKDMVIENCFATDLYRKAYPHADPKEMFIAGDVIITDNTKAGDYIK